MWIKLVQACTLISQSIKDISRITSFIYLEITLQIHVMIYLEKLYTVEGCLCSLVSRVTCHILFQYINDYYTLMKKILYMKFKKNI